jgi:hypothetical protein
MNFLACHVPIPCCPLSRHQRARFCHPFLSASRKSISFLHRPCLCTNANKDTNTNSNTNTNINTNTNTKTNTSTSTSTSPSPSTNTSAWGGRDIGTQTLFNLRAGLWLCFSGFGEKGGGGSAPRGVQEGGGGGAQRGGGIADEPEGSLSLLCLAGHGVKHGLAVISDGPGPTISQLFFEYRALQSKFGGAAKKYFVVCSEYKGDSGCRREEDASLRVPDARATEVGPGAHYNH